MRRRPDPFATALPLRYGMSVFGTSVSDMALLDVGLGDDPVFHVGDWVEVMRLDGIGNDVRYGESVACWARLSPAEQCGFETWYRVNFGSD